LFVEICPSQTLSLRKMHIISKLLQNLKILKNVIEVLAEMESVCYKDGSIIFLYVRLAKHF